MNSTTPVITYDMLAELIAKMEAEEASEVAEVEETNESE